MKKFSPLLVIFLSSFSIVICQSVPANNWKLSISSNRKYLQHENGTPFFWLADTGWLLFKKLNYEEAEKYFDDREKKGFNVIQVMIIHSAPAVNVYGDSAFVNNDASFPKTRNKDNSKSGYWNYIDRLLDLAAKKNIYLALVPVWGSNVKNGFINKKNIESYAQFLAERYKNKPNLIWINGGDIKGNENLDVWNKLGETLKKYDKNHLITFHPFGRMQSSSWFQNKEWLDFNMFQSGHKDYSQDQNGFAEDNWKYVENDLKKTPLKPVLDGEPSYENIPHGLHDSLQTRWKAYDARRYAYWSVFAGACGHTYGNNAVMQFHKPADGKGAYGVTDYWTDAINAPGSGQMNFLKKLILSRPYFERIADQSIIADSIGSKYNYITATRGNDYLFVYSYQRKILQINLGIISGEFINVSWLNPRNGKTTLIGKYINKGIKTFVAPDSESEKNDWVLVIDDASKNYKTDF